MTDSRSDRAADVLTMNIETIMDLWRPNVNNRKAGVEWWNGSAERFAAKGLPTPMDSMAMRIIVREGMIEEGSSALDVGCGSGRFSFALEAMGADMTATDFSPKMIEQAEKRQAEAGTKVRFSTDDWHTLILEKKDWAGKFDIVLAHMTPAVVSAETFLKLSEASRNWVLMVKPARRVNSVLDELNRLVKAEEDTKALDETMAYAFDLAWLKGYSPKFEYENQTWEHDLPLDKAIEEYTLRISSMHELTEENKAAIKAHLESIAVDGSVHETSHTQIVAMYWQVKPCET
ncbi:MAG: methyltransferase domain-containing protein [Oscillospiraceae bacterium]|nr:methyltransferase domain-containing protein [Oscillospiraceae bacterium]